MNEERDSGGRRFHLLERLGGGAYGEIFLAEQRSPGGFRRRVALKVLAASLSGRGQHEAARRMRDEARLLGLLRHRNIVEVFDLVQLDRGFAVVMDAIPGPDLERVLDALVAVGSPMPVRAALEIAREVVGGRGRDARCQAPPAQIRTSGTTASGSCLG